MAYYTRIDPDPALLRGYQALIAASRDFQRAGSPARAAAATRVMRKMMDDLTTQARRTAANADMEIRRRIDATQVRPSTGSSPHMRDLILSRPLPTTLPSGAVGIAELATLNRAVNTRSGSSATPYWLVQEIGTGASDPATGVSIPSQIGRRSRGFFQPGGARPSQAQFRVHPAFIHQTGRGVAMMVIGREIQGRHFLRDGSIAALAQHRAELQRIQRQAIGGLRAV